MEQHPIEIDVKAADPAITGVFANQIADIVRGIEGVDEVELRRVDETKQDLGSIVVALVSSGAVAELFRYLADWRIKKQVVLKIKCPDGYTFEIKGDAKTIADMFKKHFRK